MNLVLKEENDPISALDRRKRQRLVEGLVALLGVNAEGGSLDLMASSGE